MKKLVNLISGAAFPAGAYYLFRQLRAGLPWTDRTVYIAGAASIAALLVYFLTGRSSLYRFLPFWKRILRLAALDGIFYAGYFALRGLLTGEPRAGMLYAGAAMAFGAFYAGFFIGAKDSFHKDLDRMNGAQFEEYCAELMRRNGWRKVRVTQASNDYGADIVAYDRSGTKWVVQCKHYEATLGNSPVQEVTAAMSWYEAEKAAVMTSSTFSRNAVSLAEANGVLLIDREDLLKMAQKL